MSDKKEPIPPAPAPEAPPPPSYVASGVDPNAAPASDSKKHPNAPRNHYEPMAAPPPGAESLKPDAQPSTSSRPGSALGRALSVENREAVVKFFSGYAEMWVGMSPIWLMGEAVTPGKKVGTKFRKGRSKLMDAAEEVREVVATSAKDIVVIVDQKIRETKTEKSADLIKTSEVIKAAGENVILVVTSSIDRMQDQLRQKNVSPELKKSMKKNGRDAIVILDKALRHPVVITGVSKFARSKGIPHADALLRLASLGLAKILASMPEENLPHIEQALEEVDAAELELKSSEAAREEAIRIGKKGEGSAPKVQTGPTPPGGLPSSDPYEKMRKESSCVLM